VILSPLREVIVSLYLYSERRELSLYWYSERWEYHFIDTLRGESITLFVLRGESITLLVNKVILPPLWVWIKWFSHLSEYQKSDTPTSLNTKMYKKVILPPLWVPIEWYSPQRGESITFLVLREVRVSLYWYSERWEYHFIGTQRGGSITLLVLREVGVSLYWYSERWEYPSLSTKKVILSPLWVPIKWYSHLSEYE
jgi:hypothetical protein